MVKRSVGPILYARLQKVANAYFSKSSKNGVFLNLLIRNLKGDVLEVGTPEENYVHSDADRQNQPLFL
jgi:hypothetical protein